jgi:hypothetical protein
MTPTDITALEQRAWTVSRLFDANPPDGGPTDSYVLKRNGQQVMLDPSSATYAGDLSALLAEPLPPAPVPVQVKVAAALQALQAQPTISGADLASVISALTA